MYRIIFLDFKYEPPSFVFIEIGTNSKTPTTPSVVHVATTRLVNPLKGGTYFKFISLPIQFFSVPIQVIIATTKFVDSSDKFVKEHVEHVDPSFTIFDIGIEPSEFLLVTLPLTPHQIGIGQEITLTTNTSHASKVFTTQITTFEETFNRQKIFIVPTCFQIMNQVEPMEEPNVELVEETITQLVVKDQKNPKP